MRIEKYPFVTYSTERHSDIILARFQNNLKIDLAVAVELIDNRFDFAGDKKHYVIIDVSNVREITPKGKEYMQRPDTGLKNILGAAFVAPNPVSVLFANIFIKTQKNFQAKFFTNEEDAFVWIIEHMQKVNKQNFKTDRIE